MTKNHFFEQVNEYINTYGLLPKGCPVVAGVSGGADSLALLLLLCRLQHSLGLQIHVAHLNHCLRGEASDADEEFVRDWCRELSVPFCGRRIDIVQMAAKIGKGLEETGRQARHEFFNELAEMLDSGRPCGQPPARIALAHHQDDQAETILMHLGRGSGLDGLAGMKPQSGRLIRPLLGQSRRSIEAWLAGQGLDWHQDASNFEPFTLRNKLRLQVITNWREALGYDPAPLLGRTAESLAEDQKFLASLTAAAIERCRSGCGLRADEVLKLDPALQSRVLRLFWRERTGSARDLSFSHVRLLRAWLQTSAGGCLSLPGRWQARLSGQRLSLSQAAQQGGQPHPAPDLSRLTGEIPLELPGLTKIPQLNLQIAALLIENEIEIVYNSAMEYFRLDRIKGSVLRHRLPGDNIHPSGRTGGKTLKKFLNEQKIRPEERDFLPLIALGPEIVWLPGHAAGADFVGRSGDGRPGPLVRLEMRQLAEDNL